jgi:hypothetical protein
MKYPAVFVKLLQNVAMGFFDPVIRQSRKQQG